MARNWWPWVQAAIVVVLALVLVAIVGRIAVWEPTFAVMIVLGSIVCLGIWLYARQKGAT